MELGVEPRLLVVKAYGCNFYTVLFHVYLVLNFHSIFFIYNTTIINKNKQESKQIFELYLFFSLSFSLTKL